MYVTLYELCVAMVTPMPMRVCSVEQSDTYVQPKGFSTRAISVFSDCYLNSNPHIEGVLFHLTRSSYVFIKKKYAGV